MKEDNFFEELENDINSAKNESVLKYISKRARKYYEYLLSIKFISRENKKRIKNRYKKILNSIKRKKIAS